jgi:hypothetical protein
MVGKVTYLWLEPPQDTRWLATPWSYHRLRLSAQRTQTQAARAAGRRHTGKAATAAMDLLVLGLLEQTERAMVAAVVAVAAARPLATAATALVA